MSIRGPFNFAVLLLAPLVAFGDEPKPVTEIKLEKEGSAVTFSPDGKLIAAASMGGFFDKNDVLVFSTQGFTRTPFRIERPKSLWQFLEFSPDSKYLAGVSIAGLEVCIWEASSGKEMAKLTHKGAAWGARWAPDGKSLATTGEYGTVTVWDVTTWKPIVVFEATKERALAVAYSPDSKLVANGTRDGLVQIWDMDKKAKRVTLKHEGAVRAAAFSPDGKTLATGSDKKTIKLWDVGTGNEAATLNGHRSEVFCLAFSPDNQVLASAGFFDKTARLWDLKTRKEFASVSGGNTMYGVSFSPDGKLLATSNADRTVKVWKMSSFLAPDK